MPNIETLQSFRQVSDPEGDQLIHALYEELSPREIGRLFQRYMNSLEAPDRDSMPAAMQNFFKNNENLPEHADQEKIRIAEQLFLKIGPEYSLALLCRGLTVGYTAANVVKVLTSTGYLASDVKVGTAKRIMETTQFVLDVMSSNAMQPGGRGVRSILKVRFIHSMVRYHLQKHGWDNNLYGVPINQEDMAGTILTFGISAIQGLEMMNIFLSHEEKDAIAHFWNVVGYVIGVEDALNPDNYTEALALYETILERQAAATEEGGILTSALSNFIKGVLDLKYFPRFQDLLMRFLIDNDRYSDMLNLSGPSGVAEQMAFQLSTTSLRTLNRFRKNFLADQAVKPLNRFLVIKALAYFETEFDMKLNFPEEIKEHWGIIEKDELKLLNDYPMLRSIVAQGKQVLSFN